METIYPFDEEGGTCPCGGTMEIDYPVCNHDGGCRCFISAPCSRCTSSFLVCSECSLNSNEIWEICEQFLLEPDITKWNQLHRIMFNMEYETYVSICQQYDFPLDHRKWSDSEQVLFRLAA